MWNAVFQRIVIGAGFTIFAGVLIFGFVIIDQMNFEGLMLGLARIIVGILGLTIFFIFYAFSQYNQPDPATKIKADEN